MNHMCGIVGYLGKKAPVPLIVDSLRTLEYRGYDSAGIAYLDDENLLHIYKSSGKLINLENILPAELNDRRQVNGNGKANGNGKHDTGLQIGIGHIRWATHGAATEVNAHPHTGTNNDIALVHNGIIENFFELRKELQEKGQQFRSETDTESVVQLLEYLAHGESDFFKVMQQALAKLQGAYALSVIPKSTPIRSMPPAIRRRWSSAWARTRTATPNT
jgi:glucosamine--fructose-6-phosphate aminotransferase (isomerizing)